MENGKKNISFLIGEIYQSQNGFLHGRINGQKVFLKEITDREGRQKWLVNQQVEAYVSDPQPRDRDHQG